MDSESRREAILKTIQNNNKPITGSALSKVFGVSRQVIVQDIAILRAAGYVIIATPQGYILPQKFNDRHTRVLALKHKPCQIQDELSTIVDLGGSVKDVVIEHPVYGEFRADLMINSPSDLRAFMAKMQKEQAEPLSSLTEGIHLHTIEADSDDVLDRIEQALKVKGYLVENL